MKKGIMLLTALLLALFLIPNILALGEWEQFQKDKKLSAYSSLNGYFDFSQNFTDNNFSIMLQPLVNNFNNERRLVLVTSSNQLRIYDNNLILQYSQDLNATAQAITTFDWDADGNTEIMLIMNTSLTEFNFTAYEFNALTSTLTKEKEIVIYNNSRGFDFGNIVCGEFIGSGDCIFINGRNFTNAFIYAFNSSSDAESDNPLLSFNASYLDLQDNNENCYMLYLGDYQSSNRANKVFFSLADLDNDGDNEINFALTGACYILPYAYNVSKFISINNDLEVQLNKSFNGYCDASGGWTTKYFESITTKIENLYGDSKPEIIIGVNTKGYGSGEQTSYGSKLIVLDNSANYKYSRCYYNVVGTSGFPIYCGQKFDYAIFNNDIYVFSNYIGETFNVLPAYNCNTHTTASSSLELDIINVEDSGVTTDSYFNSTIKGRFDYFLQIADFDNDGYIEFLTQFGIADIEDYESQDMPFILTGDIIVGYYLSDFLINGIGQYNIPADLNEDYQLEIISSGNKTSNSFYYNPSYSNQAPRITMLYWTPTNPVCIGNDIIYSVNYTDNENDSIYMRVDCFGNGTYKYSNLSLNPSVNCNMSELGNYDAEICIRDLSHSTWASCTNHYVTTAITNCYYTGETFGNSSISAGGEANIFGFYREQFTPQPKGYTSEIFDWTLCKDWTMLYGLCPVWIWVQGIGTTLWNFIFSLFWLFLIIILIIVILAFLKKKYLNQ